MGPCAGFPLFSLAGLYGLYGSRPGSRSLRPVPRTLRRAASLSTRCLEVHVSGLILPPLGQNLRFNAIPIGIFECESRNPPTLVSSAEARGLPSVPPRLCLRRRPARPVLPPAPRTTSYSALQTNSQSLACHPH